MESTITVKQIEVTMSTNDFKQLMKEHAKNVKRIRDIQRDVAQEIGDNLSNPIPLFAQI